MPAAGKIDELPADLRTALDARLVETGWRDYRGLSDWLAERGYQIGKSTLATYGRELKQRLEAVRLATAQAQALVEAAPDDQGALAEAAGRLVQQRIFALLVRAEESENITPQSLASLGRAISEMTRSMIALRADRRAIVEQAAAEAQAAAREASDSAGGVLTEEHLRTIGRRVYGIIDADPRA